MAFTSPLVTVHKSCVASHSLIVQAASLLVNFEERNTQAFFILPVHGVAARLSLLYPRLHIPLFT